MSDTVLYSAIICMAITLVMACCALKHSMTNRKAIRMALQGKEKEALELLDQSFDGSLGYKI